MPSGYRASAPPSVLDVTTRVTKACEQSGSPSLIKCAKFFAAIASSKITIMSGVIDILDLVEPQATEAPLANAARNLANVWFDLALDCKFDLPSLESRLHPIRVKLAAAEPTA